MAESKQLDLFTFAVSRQTGRPTVAFTPQFFKTVYKYFRDGNYTYLLEMMRQSEIDSYVSGCLKGRRAGFKRDWMVRPMSDESIDTDRAEWIRGIFKNLRMRDLMEDIQEPILMIYKVIDFEWDVRDSRQVILDHVAIDQSHFKVDPKDGILKIDWAGKYEDIPDTALVCRYLKKPDMLPVTRDFILKNFGVEAWAAFLETFGEPFILGKYPPGTEKTVIEELQAALDAIARSSRGVLPDTTQIEIKEAGKTAIDHSLFTDACNKGIAISLLGHANAVEQSSGTQQIGENLTAWRAARNVSEDDMYWIEQYQNKIIKMLVDRNFGDGRYPTFEISKKDQPSNQELINAIDLAYRNGAELKPENYTRLGVELTDNHGPVKREPSPLGY